MSAFKLPKDGLTYTQDIFMRCTHLIVRDIWKDLDLSRFRRWLANFRTDEEKYFAACVLDGLVYRSQDQTVALVNQLFQRTLPDLFRLSPPAIPIVTTWRSDLQKLSGQAEPGVRFVTAVKQSDPPTKSAHYVARILKRRFAISEDWIIKPWDIPRHYAYGVRIFLFIDDFLGTGDQFLDFYDTEVSGITGGRADVYSAYIPLVAHQRGISFLKTNAPRIHISSAELLSDTHSLFNTAARYFDDGVNTSETARDFYYALLADRKISLSGIERGGFGGLELAYVFEHGAPDNCLPILWWRGSTEWIPLFDSVAREPCFRPPSDQLGIRRSHVPARAAICALPSFEPEQRVSCQ